MTAKKKSNARTAVVRPNAAGTAGSVKKGGQIQILRRLTGWYSASPDSEPMTRKSAVGILRIQE
jgi:hypothetical protein